MPWFDEISAMQLCKDRWTEPDPEVNRSDLPLILI
jgi:hypothetical protein